MPTPSNRNPTEDVWPPVEKITLIGDCFSLPNEANQSAIDRDICPSKQSYQLKIKNGQCHIIAHDQAGLSYAQTTWRQIKQIAHINKQTQIPNQIISDAPAFETRGLMLDVSRCRIPTMSHFKQIIDLMSLLKLNHLQLYTEHTFAYQNHPSVWQGFSPLTGDEIQTLSQWCQEHHIDLCPNQNSFGHMSRWLTKPAYQHLAECTDGYINPSSGIHSPIPFSFNPTDPQTLELIDSLYEELLPHFKSQLFNIGCDETIDLGQGKSKKRCQQLGKGQVYREHLCKIMALCDKHNKKPMFWGDIILNHPEQIAHLPKNCIALNWGYEHDQVSVDSCQAFEQAEFDYWVCPGTSSWCSVAGRHDNAIANLSNSARNGQQHHASGYLMTDWGDFGHLQQPSTSMLPVTYGAACAWQTQKPDPNHTYKWVDHFIFQKPLSQHYITLGNLYQKAKPIIKNRSSLFNVLLDPTLSSTPNINQVIEQTTQQDIENIFNTIKVLLQATSTQNDSYNQELTLTAQILRHATSILSQHQLKQPNGPTRSTNSANATNSTVMTNTTKLIQDIDEIQTNFKKNWQQTSREGGLQESLLRFKRIKAFHDQKPLPNIDHW